MWSDREHRVCNGAEGGGNDRLIELVRLYFA